MKSKWNTLLIITGILLIIGFIYYLYTKPSKINITNTPHLQKTAQNTKNESIKTQAPAPLAEQQKQQLANGTSSKTTEKIFDIAGGNFYFSPNKITVNSGDHVTIVILDIYGTHNFTIDNFNIKTPTLQTGQPIKVTFTADKKGIYTFYSDLPQDKQHNMIGALIVQ